MKTPVTNGSPKKEKSGAMHIGRAFPQGVNGFAPRKNEIIHVTEKHMEYRAGCFCCMHNAAIVNAGV